MNNEERVRSQVVSVITPVISLNQSNVHSKYMVDLADILILIFIMAMDVEGLLAGIGVIHKATQFQPLIIW